MITEERTTLMPLICDTLAQLNDQGSMSVKQLESALCLAPRSGYNLLTRHELTAGELRQLFNHPPAGANADAVRTALANFLLADTGWIALSGPRMEGDFDTDQILDLTIHALETASQQLHALRGESKLGVETQPEALAALQQHLSLALRMSAHAIHVARFLHARALAKSPPPPVQTASV